MPKTKQQIIILIGHDMCGKSHIATELSKRLGIPLLKLNYPKKFWDPVISQRYSEETTSQILEQTYLSVICDRGYPCDYMYSKLFNRPYDYSKAIDTDIRYSKMNTLIVLCYKDKHKHLHDEEDKEFISMADYENMTKIYLDFLKLTKCNYITINTSNEDLEGQLNIIMTNVRK